MTGHEAMLAERPKEELPLAFRPAGADDRNFMLNAWLKAHRDRGDWPKLLPAAEYYRRHKEVVAKLIDESACLVACNPEKTEQIIGFVCHDNVALHWVGVKSMFRRQGVATKLLDHAGFGRWHGSTVTCSHWTVGAKNLNAAWPLRYDPFILEPR